MMVHNAKSADELRENRICHACIGEAHLSELVEAEGRRRRCSYCGERLKSETLDGLADRIEQAFEQHYERTTRDPDGIQWAIFAGPSGNDNGTHHIDLWLGA